MRLLCGPKVCFDPEMDLDRSRLVPTTAPSRERLWLGNDGQPIRRRLPKSRASITTSFSVGGAEGYMTSGAHDDGELGDRWGRSVGRDGGERGRRGEQRRAGRD